jgi:hypothetical protein
LVFWNAPLENEIVVGRNTALTFGMDENELFSQRVKEMPHHLFVPVFRDDGNGRLRESADMTAPSAGPAHVERAIGDLNPSVVHTSNVPSGM